MSSPDSATPTDARIDLHGSRWRLVGLLLLACGFTAVCLALLFLEPEDGPIVAPGSVEQFILIVGVGFFGLTLPLFLREVLRRGPVVSVSRHGLFDRRLSSDWIPWSAITDLDAVAVGRHHFLRIAVEPDHAAALPWTRRARVSARLNRMYGEGYWLSGQGVEGGIDAVLTAIEQVWHPDA
ncbi:STM3941 family protein [Methylobacterium sp. Leaf123]|uniref:STM3941 family protein n=1 Tax=Methylobacterium sp. Leaf123 TaxID=1736264 RepID=UPI0012E74983|nr:STM3941 family protein [Methylobacterium sp. Leaf123]